jgi:hypothetical protein
VKRIALVLAAALTAAVHGPAPPAIAGLDHVPIAVGDLDAATNRHRA